MAKTLLCALVLMICATSSLSLADDVIVFTANQDFLSRIYVLRMDGSVYDYFEYEFYRFVDMEVVDNVVYVAEAFAPRVYKANIETGDLELIIDDWSLYYFYGLAFDGTYFYVDEWDLNRYEIDGSKDGTASFDEYVLGCAWDSTYLWTLDDMNIIKCWDVSGWPGVVAVPSLNFTPPSPACRGLWFDGQYFWTAESLDGLGYIYQFDYSGAVINQWLEPAFSGWSACVVRDFITGSGETSSTRSSSGFELAVYPNPLSAQARVELLLPQASSVALKVYNLAGEEIETLFLGRLPEGRQCVEWDATDKACGVYFLRLEADGYAESMKVLVIE